MISIEIHSDKDRIEAALKVVQSHIDRYDRLIHDTYYSEDVDGQPYYDPYSYAEDRKDYERYRDQWVRVKDILTAEKERIFRFEE